jgi:hypothetical protein
VIFLAAQANLKAVPRASTVVFISTICGIPATRVLSLATNLISHNHQLLPQLTFVDGCVIVNFEQSLTHKEFLSIREQSLCRIQVPQMPVNLEEYFPHRSFSAKMLYRMRNKFFDEKYGTDGHNLPDLFVKGERIRHLGGLFLVVPSTTDFSIETIHCQTKLMGEYARVYGVDGFKMADGTHKITKYDMTFVFWMVIDCLLRSKFVGYTANFSENSKVIIDGAAVFFKHETSPLSDSTDENCLFVGGIAGYFDPFVDNEIDLDADNNDPDAKPAAKLLSDDSLPNSLLPKSLHIPDIVTSPLVAAFMTDEGPAFPSVAERFGWLICWIDVILLHKSLLLGMVYLIHSNSNQMCITF